MWTPRQAASQAPNSAKTLSPVVVAAVPLAYGVRLEAKDLRLAHVPAEAAPVGAFTSISQVLQQPGGAPVVLAAVAAREPLLPSKLSGPGVRPTLAAGIAEGKRGYAIRLSDVSGVGGHAMPGDRVDIVLTRDLSEDGRDRRPLSEVVIQNVRVLGVDLNADLASTKVATPKTAVLEVSMEEAQKLAVAAELGSLSLALRRPGAAVVEAMRGISVSDVSASPGPLAATAPPQRQAARSRVYRSGGSAPRSSSSVLIIHGSSAAQVPVPSERRGGA